MKTYKQFTMLKVKVSFSMKHTGAKGKAVQTKVGDLFYVTNPEHMQCDGIKVDRTNRATLNSGYLLDQEKIELLFDVI